MLSADADDSEDKVLLETELKVDCGSFEDVVRCKSVEVHGTVAGVAVDNLPFAVVSKTYSH